MMIVGEIRRIGRQSRRGAGAEPHRRAQLVVTGDQRQGVDPRRADHQDQREQHDAEAGEPA
jgi:hypothetical protein